MSRPTVVSDKVRARVCEKIADGETIRQICAADDMPSASTIYLALANDQAFSDQYARAREAQLIRWEDELVEIADDATNDWMKRQGEEDEDYWQLNGENIQRSKVRIDARKWIMSKRLPKKYGDRVEQVLGGDPDNPVIHRIERVIVNGAAEKPS